MEINLLKCVNIAFHLIVLIAVRKKVALYKNTLRWKYIENEMLFYVVHF